MTTVHQELLDIEAALEQWRQSRDWSAVGCGQAERLAFTAGYRAGVEFNATRVIEPDEEPALLERFRRLP